MVNKGIIIGIVVVIVLVIGWWLVSPLFIDHVVDEELPGSTLEFNDGAEENHSQTDLNTRVEFSGSFVDADSFHKTSGIIKIVEIDGRKYVSFENFETTNGPDLYVYLAKDKEASEFVSLGRLKGNKGNQNYEIPDNVDLSSYNHVLIWCRAFSTLFGSAELE